MNTRLSATALDRDSAASADFGDAQPEACLPDLCSRLHTQQAQIALCEIAQSNRKAAEQIERKLAGTGISPAQLFGMIQKMPKYKGHEVLAATVVGTWSRGKALAEESRLSQQTTQLVADLNRLASELAKLKVSDSNNPVTAESAADRAKTFLNSLNPKVRKTLELKLIGGPSLEEVVTAAARTQALDLSVVNDAVTRSQPKGLPPLPTKGWIEREKLYELKYRSALDLERKLHKALNLNPWDLPMQIRTLDGKRLDIYRGGADGVMILDPTKDASVLHQPESAPKTIVDYFGIGDKDLGVIVVSFGTSDRVMSNNVPLPYQDAGAEQSDSKPSLSSLPMREILEANRQYPVNPQWDRTSPTEQRTSAPTASSHADLQRLIKDIGKEKDLDKRKNLVHKLEHGLVALVEHDFKSQLFNPGAELQSNRPSYVELFKELKKLAKTNNQEFNIGFYSNDRLHSARILDFIGSIEADLNTRLDAAAVDQALLSIDQRLRQETTTDFLKTPKMIAQHAAMLWRFRSLVESLRPRAGTSE